jgi:hypothetical protein
VNRDVKQVVIVKELESPFSSVLVRMKMYSYGTFSLKQTRSHWLLMMGIVRPLLENVR